MPLDSIGQLIVGPGLFVLGLFFAMLPFVTVRIFGVALLSLSAISGVLAPHPLLLVSGVLAVAAGAFLNYHLTGRRVKQLIEENRAKAQSGSQIMVPYCKDGSWFHPGLAYSDGLYRVGPRGGEHVVESYQHALQLLRDMPVACWRRPSPRTGLLGMVSATHWGQPPLRYDRRLLVRPEPPPT